jgi:hypothetical protein
MKLLTIIIAFLGVTLISWGEKPIDSFVEPEVVTIDRSGDKKSEAFLSEDLLKAFEERRLDKGIGNGRTMIRITVLRSFDAPVVFKWYPAPPGQESELEVKRLKVAVGRDGERIYQGIDFHQRLKLRASQELLLKGIYQHSSLQDLPQKDWVMGGLDGSKWIYEAAAGDRSILVARWSPIHPTLEETEVDRQRLSKELQLTTFSLMLWALSGIDERPY